MENTLKNKKKFFAQYWGQKILYTKNNSVEFFSVKGSRFYDEDYLELTDLKDISDEDAIEVGIKSGRIAVNVENKYDIFRNGFKEVVVGNIGGSYHNRIAIKEDYLSPQIFDFLRSKGYLLPYNGLSTEQILEYGWAKLKQPKQ